ncbi:MAG TPA: hypothetical protein VFT47_02005, partial [Vicinamibacterales bacterium]|nr:hypothetical protein [Vicinamibacterales bacterium]
MSTLLTVFGARSDSPSFSRCTCSFVIASPRAPVLHLAGAIEWPHQQRDRPHDDGLDIPEQVAERGPEINERGLRG